jgi:hypothetical protein
MFMHGQGSAEAFIVNSHTYRFHKIKVKTISARSSNSESHFRISSRYYSENANFISPESMNVFICLYLSLGINFSLHLKKGLA